MREVERLVRSYTEAPSDKAKVARVKDSHVTDLENRLGRSLGTKVNIETRKGGKRGKIVIEFYSVDDFERICQVMGMSSVEEM